MTSLLQISVDDIGQMQPYHSHRYKPTVHQRRCNHRPDVAQSIVQSVVQLGLAAALNLYGRIHRILCHRLLGCKQRQKHTLHSHIGRSNELPSDVSVPLALPKVFRTAHRASHVLSYWLVCSFEKTTDPDLIKRIVTSSAIFDAIADDYEDPVTWQPVNHCTVSYIKIEEDGKLLGLAIVNAHSRVKWEVHNLLLPTVGWKKRIELGRAFFEWLWTAGCKRVIGRVIASNRYAIKYNETVGMEIVGVEQKSFMKNGVLCDEVYFGLSAPGVN